LEKAEKNGTENSEKIEKTKKEGLDRGATKTSEGSINN